MPEEAEDSADEEIQDVEENKREAEGSNERHVTFDLAQIEESKRLIKEEIGSSDDEADEEEEKKDSDN